MKPISRGELARLAGCNAETVRYYEQIGLLRPPERSAGGHRRYDAQDAERLRLILSARNLGVPIAEIRAFIGLLDARADADHADGEGESVRATTLRILQITGDRMGDLDRLAEAVERLHRTSPPPTSGGGESGT